MSGLHVIALVVDSAGRARIADALRGERTIFCDHSQRLVEEIERHCPDVVVVAPFDCRGVLIASTIDHLKRAFPRLPVLAYCHLNRDECRALLALGHAGVDEVVIRGVDDVGIALRRMLTLTDATSQIVREVSDFVPAVAVPFLTYCVSAARKPTSVERAALALGVTRRTLVNRMSAATLPPPSVIISWCRLLVATQILEETTRTVEQIAMGLHFGSGAGLRNMFRRYTGYSPHEFRRAGGLVLAIELFKTALQSPRDPDASSRGRRSCTDLATSSHIEGVDL